MLHKRSRTCGYAAQPHLTFLPTTQWRVCKHFLRIFAYGYLNTDSELMNETLGGKGIYHGQRVPRAVTLAAVEISQTTRIPKRDEMVKNAL